MAIRTFLALDIDASIRDRLTAAAREFPETGSKVRWVAPENLHVTLKFLGDVPEPDAADVCEAVVGLAGGVEPFDFDVAGLRCVPPAGKVRMVWADVAEPTRQMAAAFEKVESALGELGFPRERRGFHPHVTLGRVKFTRNAADLRAAADRHAGTLFGTQHARGIVVYRSELTPQGAIYTPMAQAGFRPA
ncbi:MAG: RNA 2',3'-cyclic phosphodiesterase [Phycisphaerae bacterium]